MSDMGTMTAGPADADVAPTPAGPAAAGTTEIQGTLREWAIDLSQTEVAAGTIRFVVNNTGQFPHNFTVTDGSSTLAKTSNFGKSDGPQTIEVTLTPGTYKIICSLPGHAERGQQINLVVK
jgi:uncharacterized cupredoxin-like copper-binding protein